MSGVPESRITIRWATATDAPSLVDLRLAMMLEIMAARPGSVAAPDAEVATLRDDNERWVRRHLGRDFVALVADVHGSPVSTAGLIWFEHPPSLANRAGTEAYIVSVYTRPDARRQGLARTLIEQLVEHARAAGVPRVWLRASSQGRPLYESMGFRARDDDMRLTEPEARTQPGSPGRP